MSQTVLDHDQISSLIKGLAAEQILPLWKSLEDHQVDTKKHAQDYVTAADVNMELALTKRLLDMYPGSAVVGEEAVAKNPDLLNALEDDSQTVWVIDPVDGTKNFVEHNPNFGVILACVQGGITRHGWIYRVIDDQMFYAQKGQGAVKDGVSIKAAAPKKLKDSKGFIGYKLSDAMEEHGLLDIFPAETTLGSCAIEYSEMAQGHGDYTLYRLMNPWDHLAGVLLFEEAGGYSCQWDGSPYTPKDRAGGMIAATSKDLAGEIKEHLQKPEIYRLIDLGLKAQKETR